jgi:hypothetical protein
VGKKLICLGDGQQLPGVTPFRLRVVNPFFLSYRASLAIASVKSSEIGVEVIEWRAALAQGVAS